VRLYIATKDLISQCLPLEHPFDGPCKSMLLLELESIEYLRFLEIQRTIVDRKIAQRGPDVLMLLEHPPTITLGTRGRSSSLTASEEDLAKYGVPVHSTDRGGEATYHGPGQLVGYPLVDLKGLKLSVRDYVFKLEETVLVTLDHFGLKGFRQRGKPGVWIGASDKIASIGVRISHRITSHGFSLNVDLKIDPTSFMVCCGTPGIRMVSLNEILSEPVSPALARQVVADSFAEVYGVTLERTSLDRALAASG
jgi:lipoate-protein ligase B